MLGTANSAYFTAAYYASPKRACHLAPAPCRVDIGLCYSLLTAREARLFGVPNSLLGLVYYVTLTALALVWLLGGNLCALRPAAAASVVTVVLSSYLAWVLIRKLRVACRLCFVAHVTNVLLMACLVGLCVLG